MLSHSSLIPESLLCSGVAGSVALSSAWRFPACAVGAGSVPCSWHPDGELRASPSIFFSRKDARSPPSRPSCILFSLPLVSSDVLLASQTGGEIRIHPERWDARVPGASSSGPALLLPCVGSVPRCSRCFGAAALSAKRVISSRSDVRFVKQSHSL